MSTSTFKASSIILLLAVLNIQGIQSWVQDPWFSAYQSLRAEHQHTSLVIGTVSRQVSTEIAGRITTLSWKLNQIKNQAEYIQTTCARKTLADIETFFGTLYLIHECRNSASLNELRERQSQQINVESNKVKVGQTTCREEIHYQPCADKITKEIQARLLEIREETRNEAQGIADGSTQCAQERGDKMIGTVQEIEANWNRC